MSSSAFRFSLKHRTDDQHRKVDAAFAHFDLADESGLEGFLTAQAAALRPLERAIVAGGVTRLLPDWAARSRAHLLDDLGLVPVVLVAPPIVDRASMLGTLYVLEGSKLGARFLLRRLGQPEGRFAQTAMRFLGHDAEPERWTSFVHLLERHANDVDDAACLDAAIAAFGLFEAAAITVAEMRGERHETLDAPMASDTGNDRVKRLRTS